jgi:tetratricopeptide (TPR) repeat protein
VADVFYKRTITLVSSLNASEKNHCLNLKTLLLVHKKSCERRIKEAVLLLAQAIDCSDKKRLPLNTSINLLIKAYNEITSLSDEEPSKLRLSILTQLGPRLVIRSDENELDLPLAVAIWRENPDAGIFTLPTLRQLAQSLVLRSKEGDLDQAIEILMAIDSQLDDGELLFFYAHVKSDLGAVLAIRNKNGDIDRAIPILKDGLRIIQQLSLQSIHEIEKGISGALGAAYLKRGIEDEISEAIGFLQVATTAPFPNKAATAVHFRNLWIALSVRKSLGDVDLRIHALQGAIKLESNNVLKFDDLRRLVIDLIARSSPNDINLIIECLEECVNIAPDESLKELAEEELANVLEAEGEKPMQSQTSQKPQLRLPPM